MRLPDAQIARIFAGESPITVLREYRELTVAELAKRSGLSPDYMEKVEAGSRGLTDERRAAIAAALGVHPLELRKCSENFAHCALTLALDPDA